MARSKTTPRTPKPIDESISEREAEVERIAVNSRAIRNHKVQEPAAKALSETKQPKATKFKLSKEQSEAIVQFLRNRSQKPVREIRKKVGEIELWLGLTRDALEYANIELPKESRAAFRNLGEPISEILTVLEDQAFDHVRSNDVPHLITELHWLRQMVEATKNSRRPAASIQKQTLVEFLANTWMEMTGAAPGRVSEAADGERAQRPAGEFKRFVDLCAKMSEISIGDNDIKRALAVRK